MNKSNKIQPVKPLPLPPEISVEGVASAANCSPLKYYPIHDTQHEVATWGGEDAQERAEAAYRGWKLLGSKPCVSVRKRASTC